MDAVTNRITISFGGTFGILKCFVISPGHENFRIFNEILDVLVSCKWFNGTLDPETWVSLEHCRVQIGETCLQVSDIYLLASE